MKTYRVWFRQVNQMYIDVKARTLNSAMIKAGRGWIEENQPSIDYVEKEDKEVWPTPETPPI